MSPEEIAESNRDDPANAVTPGWYLLGVTHPDWFTLAGSETIVHLGCTYAGSQGTTFVVLAQQVGCWQHRLVLPLVGEDVRAFMAYVQGEPVRFALGSQGSTSTLFLTGPRYLNQVMPQGLVVSAVPDTLVDVLGETCAAVAALMRPSALWDAALPKVEHVCLSIVQSRQLWGKIDDVLAE
jgi:hypothetical protein